MLIFEPLQNTSRLIIEGDPQALLSVVTRWVLVTCYITLGIYDIYYLTRFLKIDCSAMLMYNCSEILLYYQLELE